MKPTKPKSNLLSLIEGSDFQREFSFLRRATRPSLDQQLARLRGAYRNRTLCIVLGAGVSVPYGLPAWNRLLEALLFTVFESEERDDPKELADILPKVIDLSPLIVARFLRKNLPNLENQVQRIIYEDLATEHSALMQQLKNLCVAPGMLSPPDSIITYNYDDILEDALERAGLPLKFQSIDRDGVQVPPDTLPIYHVHGYLPRPARDSGAPLPITLAEDAYHAQYRDAYSWANLIQLDKFRTKVCLFIGLSLTDPNQRRLLDIALASRAPEDAHHIALFRRESAERVASRLKILGKSGIGSLSPEMIARRMDEFRESDALSLGVEPLWVDEFDEVPGLLHRVYESSSNPIAPP